MHSLFQSCRFCYYSTDANEWSHAGVAAPWVQQQPSSPVTIAEPTKQLPVEVSHCPVQTLECIFQNPSFQNPSASKDIHEQVYLIAIHWDSKLILYIVRTVHDPKRGRPSSKYYWILDCLHYRILQWHIGTISTQNYVYSYLLFIYATLFFTSDNDWQYCPLLLRQQLYIIPQSLEANKRRVHNNLTRVQTGSGTWCLHLYR